MVVSPRRGIVAQVHRAHSNCVGIVRQHIETAIRATAYRYAKHHFIAHSHVNHSAEEYVRGDIHTNTIEGFFSILKRGMRGVYQFCSEKHLHRYLAEFNFRYSNRISLGCNDEDRANRLLSGIVGNRLTYQQSCGEA